MNFNEILDMNIFIQVNAFENIICEMVVILFWTQYVKKLDLASGGLCLSHPIKDSYA